MVLANLLEVCVQTMRKKDQPIDVNDWKKYEEVKYLPFSYIKKSGKHRRTESKKEDNA